MPRIATIILARKNSKRLPGKNVIDKENPVLLCGEPLLFWTVGFAVELGYPVHLYTDCENTKKELAIYPITIHDKLFEDADGKHETGKELIEYNKELTAEHMILLQVTSPLRKVEDAKKWIDFYIKNNFDAGFSAIRCKSGFYYSENSLVNFSFSNRGYNSGGINFLCRETGSFYIFRTSQLVKKHFLDTKRKAIFCDHYDIDINTIDDLKKAEKIYIEEQNEKAEN